MGAEEVPVVSTELYDSDFDAFVKVIKHPPLLGFFAEGAKNDQSVLRP